MTGYGKSVLQLPTKKISIEIKSLNSKNLDLNTRMPSLYREKELDIRKIKTPPLRSSAFYFETKGDDDSLSYIFAGAGWGHGVGMCQSGAIGRANAGHTFNEILNHYFRGTILKDVFE